MRKSIQITVTGIPALLIAAAAEAHSGLVQPAGFAAGFVHPFVGLDHLVAMLAMGVYAGRHGGGLARRLPIVVVAAAGAGMLFGAAGPWDAAIELGIIGSVLLLGLTLFIDRGFGMAWGMVAAVVFGAVHGHAHGVEMGVATTAVSDTWSYCSGLLAGTGLALAVGTAAGALSLGQARLGDVGIKALGAATCAVALLILVP